MHCKHRPAILHRAHVAGHETELQLLVSALKTKGAKQEVHFAGSLGSHV